VQDVPAALLAAINIPAQRSIDWHQIRRMNDPNFAKDFDCNVVFDDISSNFVYVTFHMDTTNLEPEHRKYLGLYVQSLTESEMTGDDRKSIIEYDDVVVGLSQNLMNLMCYYGVNHVTPFTCGDYNHIMSVSTQVNDSA
jgi:Zn-dependent M16 (insulinase) family peptidase